jgi:small conductance mechanosensitive channel
MEVIFTRLAEIFSPEKIADKVLGHWLPDMIVAALTFAAFYALWRLLAKGVTLLMARAGVEATATRFVELMLKYLVLTLGTITALAQMGVNTASLIASLGVAGLTLGFAAQDVLSNIISGLFIFWDRPFVIGDLVEIDGQYGRVETITMRSTRVVTTDGKMLAIPNSVIANSTVTSYTNFPNLRLDVEVTVGVNEDLGRVRVLLLDQVRGRQEFMDAPPPSVVVKALNDYNVLLELRAWIHDEKEHIQHRFELRERIFTSLTEAGVDMPCETLSINPIKVVNG